MAFIDFDLESVPVQAAFELLQPGWYGATISGAEIKLTKSGDGQYVQIGFVLANNRKLLSNFNIRSANAAAETIGRQQLAELVRAVGLARFVDTDQVVGLRVDVKVKIRPAGNGYEACNDVQATRAAGNGTAMPSAPRAVEAVATVAPPRAPSPPWAKKQA